MVESSSREARRAKARIIKYISEELLKLDNATDVGDILTALPLFASVTESFYSMAGGEVFERYIINTTRDLKELDREHNNL